MFNIRYFINLIKEEGITAYAALLVSILSLSLSILQGYQSIEHDKLSVLPHLDFDIQTDEGEQGKDGIYLVNRGLGPAIINKVDVWFNGRKIDFTQFMRFLETEKIVEQKNEATVVWRLPINRAQKSIAYILSTEHIPLFTIPEKHIKNRTKFQNLVYSQISMKIHYCSFYNWCLDSTLNR